MKLPFQLLYEQSDPTINYYNLVFQVIALIGGISLIVLGVRVLIDELRGK